MPQRLIYLALHNDYSETFCPTTELPEDRCGQIAAKRLLEGGRGHYGPLEHPQLSLLLQIDHNTAMQLRTHRVGLTFDVQCLSGDTEVIVLRRDGKICHRRPIQKLYEQWQSDPQGVKRLRIRSLNEETNTYTTNHIEAVIDSGVKQTYWVTLADGKQIRCTKEHRILSPKGWKTLADLKVGDKVMVNGRATADAPATYQNKEWLKERFDQGLIPKELAQEAGVSTEAIKKWAYHHGLSWQHRPKWNTGTTYTLDLSEAERERRRHHARTVLAAAPKRKGELSPHWNSELPLEKRAYNWLKYAKAKLREQVNHRCQDCGQASHRLHCHHVIPVEVAPELGCDEGNIRVLCPRCHKRAHALAAHPVAIVSIEEAGECHTFDIAMAAPHHNFVANGIVVHNSQRYTGERILKAATGEIPVEEVFYIRPAGRYHDRQGEPYSWSEGDIHQYKTMLLHGAQNYAFLRGKGASEEHARGILPTCYFQNTAISGNLRAWLHLLDVRLKADAQDEIRWAMQLAAQQVQRWVPEIYSWYAAARKGKAQLAP